MGLTLPVPVQYCSLQHQALLSPADTSTTEHYFHFGPATSFFLELFLCSCLVAYCTSPDLGGSSSNVIYFSFSYCSWGSQGKNTEVVCHSLLHGPHFIRTLHQDLSVLGLDHSLTELHKAVIPVVILVSFCDHVSLCGGCSIIVLASSVCPLMDEDQRPVQASRWEALAVGKTGSCSGEQGLDY